MNILETLKGYDIEIKSGYAINGKHFENTVDSRINKYGLVAIRNGNAVSIVGYLDQSIYFSKTPNDKDSLIETTRRELIRNYFNPSEAEFFEWENGYSIRTAEYFKSIEEQCGFIKIVHAEYGDGKIVQVDVIGTVDMNYYTDATLGKYEEQYVISYNEQFDIDNFWTTQIYFSKIPSKEDIQIICTIDKLKLGFSTDKIQEQFVCYECGSKVHWLDVPGDLYVKANAVQEKYCGC